MLNLRLHFFGQLGQGLVGALHLAVFVEIPLSVLHGGERGIQGDGHCLAGIVVQGLEGFRPGLGAVAVGIQQLAVDAVGVPLFSVFHLAQLQVVFLHVPLQGGLHNPAQIRGFLADMGEYVLLRVVMLQQGGHGAVGDCIVPGGSIHIRPLKSIHRQRERAEFYRTATCVSDVGGEVLLPDGVDHAGKRIEQMPVIRVGQRRGGEVSVNARLIAQFLCQNGRNAGKAAIEGFKDSLGLSGKHILECLPVGSQGIQFVLGGGNEIGLPRQYLAQGADSGGYMFDAVDDRAVAVTEDDIAVLPHDFHNQGLPAQIPHLVQMLDIDMDDALQPRLGYADDAAVLQMLAQEHAEARRRHGAGLACARQVEQGQGSLGGNQQFLCAVRLLDSEQQLVRLGLGDFIEPPAHELSFQFRYHICYGHAVKGHSGSLRP